MLESPTYTVRYLAEGDTVAENYGSALGALGRIQMLMEYGVGYDYTIYVDMCLLMDQHAIFESLKIRHN